MSTLTDVSISESVLQDLAHELLGYLSGGGFSGPILVVDSSVVPTRRCIEITLAVDLSEWKLRYDVYDVAMAFEADRDVEIRCFFRDAAAAEA